MNENENKENKMPVRILMRIHKILKHSLVGNTISM